MATCPECDAEIEVDEYDVDKGDQVNCPECGRALEVVGLAPVELDLVSEEEEEEEEEEEDEEDDLEEED
jgi:alpha-aminoadipate/glutamate carrier protein LysW